MGAVFYLMGKSEELLLCEAGKGLAPMIAASPTAKMLPWGAGVDGEAAFFAPKAYKGTSRGRKGG